MSFLHQASQSDHPISARTDSWDVDKIADAYIAIDRRLRVRGRIAAILVFHARALNLVAKAFASASATAVL